MAIQAQLNAENFGFAFGASQEFPMENGCGLDNWCLIPQSQQQLIQLQNPNFDHQSLGLSQCISSHFEKQRVEVEQFVNLQGERLRLAMQEKRRQQISQLLQKYESRAQFLLNQKEEQISKAIGRRAELEDQLRRMEAESQAWQRAARENESTVASLNSTIERLRQSAAAANAMNAAAEDAESCCQNREEEEKLRQQSSSRPLMPCRSCNRRNSCVVMLPCRHLCCCRDCGAVLDSCPVCRTVKKASIEALM